MGNVWEKCCPNGGSFGDVINKINFFPTTILQKVIVNLPSCEMAIENSFKYFSNIRPLMWILLVKYGSLLLTRKWLLLTLGSITSARVVE